MWTSVQNRNNAPLPERSEIKGWTKGAARRNKLFLMSVDPVEVQQDLTYAITLTLPETPDTAKDWQTIVNRFLTAMRRLGMIRYHWVTEWTRKGRPHLHATIAFAGRSPVKPAYWPLFNIIPDARALLLDRSEGPYAFDFEAQDTPFITTGRHRKIIGPSGAWKRVKVPNSYADQFTDHVVADAVFQTWCKAAMGMNPSERAQHVERVHEVYGWAVYVAKHAGRGVDHYQRENENMPDGWKSSGRLWSRGGEWPVRNDNLEVDPVTFYRYRRVLRRWQISRVKEKIARYYGKPRQQAVNELRWLKRSKNRAKSPAENETSFQGEYAYKRRQGSDVSGLVSFADRQMLDLLFVWAMDHSGADCFDSETGEVVARSG